MNKILNCNGRLLDLSSPKVMAILNLTPDSFYDGGQHQHVDQALLRVEQYISEGADIIDIGGMSTRPGATMIGSDVECERIIPTIKAIKAAYPSVFLSVDTIYGATVRRVADLGVDIINDVSAGSLDQDMLPSAAAARLPYILMHMQGSPADMQDRPHYEDLMTDITAFLRNKVRLLNKIGIHDIVIDPGFGFGKNLEHNYTLLRHLDHLAWLELPILAGLSRKSMIYKALDITSNESLSGTIALNMVALLNGASILRVHDVRPAKQQIHLYQHLTKTNNV